MSSISYDAGSCIGPRWGGLNKSFQDARYSGQMEKSLREIAPGALSAFRLFLSSLGTLANAQIIAAVAVASSALLCFCCLL